jgi:CRP-like cAMP-binding protein
MTWKEYDGVPVALFQPGDVFGEIEVYKNSPRLFTLMSITELNVLTLDKQSFRKIFFRTYPQLGNRFIDEMERKFVYLERIMQMVVDCVFNGKNLYNFKESIINFDKQGSFLKVEDKQNYLINFLCSYRSKIWNKN